jgi:hypothetical protein
MTHSVIKHVDAYVFFRPAKRKRDQQSEGSLEATMKLEANAAEV